jgi:hypothetical protein|tara:strand:+ start:329 stop:760 length:432 start_codon:yes stop_codon:yes gene_type:complete
MKKQEVRNIIQLANYLSIDKRELFDQIDEKSESFEVENYTFLSEDEALKGVINMYECDEYILGCFNASFIEDYIALDCEDIKTIQEGEHYEIIGKLILNSGKLEEMMKEYIRLDGFGHALNSYDGTHNEINLNGIDYIYFRNN